MQEIGQIFGFHRVRSAGGGVEQETASSAPGIETGVSDEVHNVESFLSDTLSQTFRSGFLKKLDFDRGAVAEGLLKLSILRFHFKLPNALRTRKDDQDLEGLLDTSRRSRSRKVQTAGERVLGVAEQVAIFVADELPRELPKPGDIRVGEIQVDAEPKAFLRYGLDGTEAPGVKELHIACEEAVADPLTDHLGLIPGHNCFGHRPDVPQMATRRDLRAELATQRLQLSTLDGRCEAPLALACRRPFDEAFVLCTVRHERDGEVVEPAGHPHSSSPN
jgi:hypothetical protein